MPEATFDAVSVVAPTWNVSCPETVLDVKKRKAAQRIEKERRIGMVNGLDFSRYGNRV
jgi:hypothetical protein